MLSHTVFEKINELAQLHGLATIEDRKPEQIGDQETRERIEKEIRRLGFEYYFMDADDQKKKTANGMAEYAAKLQRMYN